MCPNPMGLFNETAFPTNPRHHRRYNRCNLLPSHHRHRAYLLPSFLKQILPKGFDFGDLAILFLLLLMAGDNKENRDNALLTMALYFIL